MISRFSLSAVALLCLSASAQAGFVEICKASSPAGAVSGLFSFTVAGQAGTFSTPVNACTTSFQLPDGPAFITEIPQIGSKIFGVTTFPTSRLDSFDPTTGTAKVEIVAGDISNQTVVTFTNTIVAVPEPATWTLLGLGLIACVLFIGKISPKRASKPGIAASRANELHAH